MRNIEWDSDKYPLMTHTDEQREVVADLELATRFLEDVVADDELWKWKWALITLSTAVQGFMIIALTSTFAVEAHRDDIRKKRSEAQRDFFDAVVAGDKHATKAAQAKERDLWTRDRVPDFKKLYRRFKNDDDLILRQLGMASAFKPGPTCDESLELLRLIRNDYMHFRPGLRTISLSRLPIIAVDTLTVISFMLNETTLIKWFNPEHESRARSTFARAMSAAAQLRKRYPPFPVAHSE